MPITSYEEAHGTLQVLLHAGSADAEERTANWTALDDTLHAIFVHDNDEEDDSKNWLTTECVQAVADIARQGPENLRLQAINKLAIIGMRAQHTEKDPKALGDIFKR